MCSTREAEEARVDAELAFSGVSLPSVAATLAAPIRIETLIMTGVSDGGERPVVRSKRSVGDLLYAAGAS